LINRAAAERDVLNWLSKEVLTWTRAAPRVFLVSMRTTVVLTGGDDDNNSIGVGAVHCRAGDASSSFV